MLVVLDYAPPDDPSRVTTAAEELTHPLDAPDDSTQAVRDEAHSSTWIVEQPSAVNMPSSTTTMYMDDLVYRAATSADLERADQAVHDFGADWGISISPKTKAFSVSWAGTYATQRLPYETTGELKWLGAYFHLPHSQRQQAEAAFDKKLAVARQRLHRVAWMRPPWDLRQHYIASNALAGLVWAPLGQPHSLPRLRALDTQVFHIMMGETPRRYRRWRGKCSGASW